MSGQLVCAGCGSEFMSWPTASLLTKVTRVPRGTTRSFGDTPAAVMVIVVPPLGAGVGAGVGDGVGEGAAGELSPPHEATVSDVARMRDRAARLAARSERAMTKTSEVATVDDPLAAPGEAAGTVARRGPR